MKSIEELRESFNLTQNIVYRLLKDKVVNTLITHCVKINIQNQIDYINDMDNINYKIREVYIDELKEQLKQVKF